MLDFAKLRKDAYEDLIKSETVTVIDEKKKGILNFKKFTEVWEVNKLISMPDEQCKEVTLFICLKSDFPLSVPSIYLSKESYDEIKYIPHVDTDYLICLYDSESTVTNPESPAGIVDLALRKARQIIEEGLKKLNYPDFLDEFISYWENKYEQKDNVNLFVLSFIQDNPINKPVKLLLLPKSIKGFQYVLFQDNEEANNFKTFLDEREIKYEESELFYIDQDIIADEPPFNLTSKQTFDLIKKIDEATIANLTKFLNKGNFRKMVLIRKGINGNNHYLGWIYPEAKVNRNGFRDGTITIFQALSTFQSSDLVQRISPMNYTKDRLNKRTKGDSKNSNFKILVAGLGSIGSNLIFFLNSFDKPEFRLIDYDFLTMENTQRHLLGFNYLNINKAKAVSEYLKLNNPKQTISVREDSLINVFDKEPEYVNNSDFIFLVTGKWNIEKYIAEQMKQDLITKPVFILWVEPYLAGGHCIYMHPECIKHEEFYKNYDGRSLFKYNVINETEYLTDNKILKMKEASCQTTYIPYSGSNVVSFLSHIHTELSKLIVNVPKESVSITWIGDKEDIESKKIKLSKFAENSNSFSVVINKL